MIEQLERQLDSFDADDRCDAIGRLAALARAGDVKISPPGEKVNMHCHTFFSYNSYGYSPSKYAWLAKKAGLALAGIVDFDVLDGLDEFVAAGRLLGLKTCGGLESRVFVPEFAEKVMTSPGEPGITYHMGVGFPTGGLSAEMEGFTRGLKETAQRRNCDLTGRVNAYLSPVELDYEKDVIPLTPAGNATERHICLAYVRKAAEFFGEGDALADFWSDKLGADAAGFDLPAGGNVLLLNTIRARTMKRGGAGYVQPDAVAFPTMAQVNEFILAAGGVPTLTWLDGQSEGEKQIEKLIDVAKCSGVAAINIIPDRNFTPGVKDEMVDSLNHIIGLARQLEMPVIVGTEMNSPGQKFVDDFDSAELSGHVPVFVRGAYIMYAHSIMQRQWPMGPMGSMGPMGYCSDWAKRNFADTAERNDFFEAVGRAVDPQHEDRLSSLTQDARPEQILALM